MKRRKVPHKAGRPDAVRKVVSGDSSGPLVFRFIFVGLLFALVIVAIYLVTPAKYTGPSHNKEETKRNEPSEKIRHFSSEKKGNKDERVAGKELMESCEDLITNAWQLVRNSPPSDWHLALNLLATCALQEPSNHASRWNMAVILMDMGRAEEAFKFMLEAIWLDPNNPVYLKNSSFFLAQMGFHSQVILHLEGYLEVKLNVPSWGELLVSISSQREDEWEFLFKLGADVIQVFEVLQSSYLQEMELIKAGCLYKVLIGLTGEGVDMELLSSYSFFAFGLGDFVTGIKYLRQFTERQFVLERYGDLGQAYEVVSAHSLRLFTTALDSLTIGIGKNILSGGDTVWEEFAYNCKLGSQDALNYTTRVYQSELWRVFIGCVQRQKIVEHLIEEGSVVYADNYFGWTPLLHAVSIGSRAMVNLLLEKKADPLSRTMLAHTSLHVVAMRGTFDVISPLLQAGLSMDEVDYVNRTALQVACLHRWSAEGLARALDIRLPADCHQGPLYHRPPLLITYGGWLSTTLSLPQDLTNEQCDFDVLSGSDAQTFVFDYLSLLRPVLIRNATSIHSMKRFYQLWQRNKFVSEYGHLMFKEVDVPYTAASGSPETSLKDFLGKMKQFQAEHKHLPIDSIPWPPYIFKNILWDSTLLTGFSLPAVLDVNITHISPTKFKFHVGPPLSGVPVQISRNSWNVLVYGQRRWFLHPPDRAFSSKEHILEWWRDSYRGSPDALECVQYPGDLVFVPDVWGHAFINLREGLGIASEFIYGASEFSI